VATDNEESKQEEVDRAHGQQLQCQDAVGKEHYLQVLTLDFKVRSNELLRR
jgi:hypothetical protein